LNEGTSRCFLALENFDEARHVRTLEVLRQIDIHVEFGHGVLCVAGLVANLNRVANAFDADLVDRDAAGVGT
jgi:hypothetical protein